MSSIGRSSSPRTATWPSPSRPTPQGTCAAACELGASCTKNADCKQGECAGAGSENGGFCAPTCKSSSECPSDSFCVEAHCLHSCAGNSCGEANATCVERNNSELQAVTVCAPPEPSTS